MTDRELEQRLRAWYAAQAPESETAPDDLRASLAAIPATVPAPLRPLGRSRRFGLLAVAAVLVVGGALAAGSGIVRFTSVVPPAPSDAAELSTPAPAPSATARPTPYLRPGALVAFLKWTDEGIWIAGGGSEARALVPGEEGHEYGRLAWAPDGSRLLYSQDQQLFVADVNGGDPQRIDTGCVAPCDVDTDAAFSSDGTKIVFVRQSQDAGGQAGSATIATMDLASGRVAVLASTAPDGGWWPSWSPDGQRIVFAGYGEGDSNALFVVDQDGGNLHQIGPALARSYPEWSPDGSRIVFWTADFQKGPRVKDVYTIRPDGTDLRQLTSDGVSSAASWTADGRILFARKTVDAGGRQAVSFWTMDADGTNATMLVPSDITGIGDDEFPPVRAVPQPLGGPSIASIARASGPAIAVGPPPPAPTPPALAPGFSWTGALLPGDGDHSDAYATRLADGRVLYLYTTGCSTRAQVYDPTTGTFEATGSTTVARSGASWTLLRDGRVLLAGGAQCGDSRMVAAAELYDPSTGTFTPTGSMRTPRLSHAAALLADGRVLITGGLSGPTASGGSIRLVAYQTAEIGGESLATAEVYDPATGRFSKTGSMSGIRDHHTATLLADGRVLVAGGGNEGQSRPRSADLYDPRTGTFSKTGSMNFARWLHTATPLDDGRVLITGGRTPDDDVRSSAELYDPRSGQFSTTGEMADARHSHAATRLLDGRVLVAGGNGYQPSTFKVTDLSSTEVFDPHTGTFTSTGTMGYPRGGSTATLLEDGRVLIAGGSYRDRRGDVPVLAAVLYQP